MHRVSSVRSYKHREGHIQTGTDGRRDSSTYKDVRTRRILSFGAVFIIPVNKLSALVQDTNYIDPNTLIV